MVVGQRPEDALFKENEELKKQVRARRGVSWAAMGPGRAVRRSDLHAKSAAQVATLQEEVERYIHFMQVGPALRQIGQGGGRRMGAGQRGPSPLAPRLQAIEAETDRADETARQERSQHQQAVEALEQDVTAWKVQFFDQKYERCAWRLGG